MEPQLRSLWLLVLSTHLSFFQTFSPRRSGIDALKLYTAP